MAGRPPKIEIPRWIQLVGLPILVLLGWTVAGAIAHVLFLFVVAALVALLLNPLVRGLGRVWIPRGFAVAIVYLAFAAAVGMAVLALATVVVDQTNSASKRVNAYFRTESGQPRETGAQHDVDRLQEWLDTHRLKKVRIEKQGKKLVSNVGSKDATRWTERAISWAEGAAVSTIQFLFNLVLVVVISIYMLLDLQRFSRWIDRRFPPGDDGPPLVPRVEMALASYVKGQLLLSLIIGTSAGLGMWLLGTLGWVPGADKYAVLFGAWVALTELIPYLGPWLGAVPAVIYAFAVHPISAVWVVLLFLFIHQAEGHVVVPKVMGNALRLHPLVVIVALLGGGEIYGLPGALVALPLAAAIRATWEFFGGRLEREAWPAGGAIPVAEGDALLPPLALEPEEPARTPAAREADPPADPPAAAAG
jgi:predicted PurR-regulated permease PerM